MTDEQANIYRERAALIAYLAAVYPSTIPAETRNRNRTESAFCPITRK